MRRSRAQSPVLFRGTVVGLLALASWAGVLDEPATSPPWPAMSVQASSLHEELTWALAAERSAQYGTASVSRSRQEPPPPPPPPPPAPEVVWPASGALTGWFGERRASHLHPGIDVDGDLGDPVVAAAAGNVVHAGPAPAGYSGYGVVVIVAHGGGLVSIYAHLSQLSVRPGQGVTPGQRVGAVGTTGNVTGSHLHFELRRGGTAVDPRPWLPTR